MRRASKRVVEGLVTCVSVVAAACAPEPVAAPARASAPAASSALAAAAPSVEGRYLVTFTAGVPSDFEGRVGALGGSVAFAHAGARLGVVQGLSAAAASTLATSAGVAGVEADAVIRLGDDVRAQTMPAPDALAVSGAAGGTSPANPAGAFFYGLGFQWNLQAIHAPQAWAAGKLGSPGVTVAILDTGIDYTSVDLAGLVDLSRSVSFVPTDDALAQALFPGVHPSTDLNGHGTHVAAQVVSNGYAFAAVASRTRLMSVKIGRVDRLGSFSDMLRGLIYAVDQGADVANISFGTLVSRGATRGDMRAFATVLSYTSVKGMLVIVGAGNDRANLDQIGGAMYAWCEMPLVICVSATGPTTPTGFAFEPAIYTNYGRSAITVAAPGGNYGGPVAPWPWGPSNAALVWAMCSRTTVVLDADGNPVATPYTSGSWACGAVGTSLASPHAAGLAALLVAEYGKMPAAQFRSLFVSRTIDLGPPGLDPYYGAGHIDVARALGL
jgi:lantibiotic leader peptide-processing serine protease